MNTDHYPLLTEYLYTESSIRFASPDLYTVANVFVKFVKQQTQQNIYYYNIYS